MEKTFAVIENYVVVNCLVAASREEAEQLTQLECVEYLNVQVGFHYQNETFSKPLT